MLRNPLVGLVVGLLVIYHANGRPHPEVDCVGAPYAAWSLVREGSLDLRSYPELTRYQDSVIRETPDGMLVSRYPLGSTLAMVPFVAPFAAFREAPFADKHMHALGKFAAACSVAAAAALFFLICSQVAPTARWPATILFGLGTCLCSVASQAIWMHGPATFWVCLALWLVLREDELNWVQGVFVGVALGMAVATRPTTAFFAMATGMVLLGQQRWRALFGVVMGGLLPVGMLCAVNWAQFGNPVLGGYSAEYGTESPPWWLGLSGLLVAPSRGILVYSPALLLVPFGIAGLWRGETEEEGRRRTMLMGWLVAAGATILYYARWHDWKGGWCYGPRFLCEAMPILCLIFAIGYERFKGNWQRSLAVGLVGLSVAVHMVGIFGYSGYEAWQRRHDLADQGRCLFALEDTQIEAHARALSRKVLRRGTQTP